MPKCLLIIFAILLLAFTLSAEEFNLRPIDRLTLYPWHITTDDGCRIVFWSYCESGHEDIYAQKLNPLGEPVWNDDIPLVSHIGNQRLLDASPASDGTFFIVWQEYGVMTIDGIRVQKVTQNGDLLWDSQGISINIAYPPFYNMEAKLVANEEGGVFVVYNANNSSDSSISGQSLDATGNLLWPDLGQYLFGSSYSALHKAIPDGEGGMIIHMMGNTNSSIYRVNANGEVVGDAPLVASNALSGTKIHLLPGLPGEFILWNRGGTNNSQIQFRKIDNQGNFLSPQTVSYYIGASDHPEHIRVQSNVSGEVYAAWIRSNYDGGGRRLMLQRFNSNFNAQWPGYGVQLAIGAIDTNDFQLAVDHSGHSWLNWSQNGDESLNKLMCISYFGTDLWPEGAVSLDSHPNIIRLLPNYNGCVLLWDTPDGMMHSVRRQYLDVLGNCHYPEDGETLIERPGGVIFTSAVYAIDDHLLSVWHEYFQDSRKIRYQRTNQSGENQWGEFGRKLNPDDSYYDEFPIARKVTDGSIYFLYRTWLKDSEDPQAMLYLQKVNQSGRTVYPGQGIPIVELPRLYYRHFMATQDSDVYLAWVAQADNDDNVIMGQRISGGQKQWGDDGRVLFTAATGDSLVIRNFVGTYLIWQKDDFNPGDSDVMALRIDGNGDPAPGWNPAGLKLVHDDNYSIQRYGSAGVIGEDLYCFVQLQEWGTLVQRLQKVNPEGQVLWPAGGFAFEGDLSLVSVDFSDDLSFIMREYSVWDTPMRFFKLSSAGEVLADTQVFNSSYDISYIIKLARLADGSYIAVFSQHSQDAQQSVDLYYYMISSEGELHSDQAIALCTEPDLQWYPKIAVFGNQAFVAWTDNRKRLTGPESNLGEPYAALLHSAYSEVSNSPQSPSVRLSLEANYPNPFNPSTTIAFNLPQSGRPVVTVYNLKGQMVKTLTNAEPYPAGEHSIVWDGRDQAGQPVSSGLYFCRLSFEGKSTVRKMVLAK